MTIENISIKELAIIVAGLVEQGLKFRAYPTADGTWTINLTGGF